MFKASDEYGPGEGFEGSTMTTLKLDHLLTDAQVFKDLNKNSSDAIATPGTWFTKGTV
ncbi:MAG: hypothetical protein AAFR83_23815 [Cyanobacteria bacterium J06629_18]